MNEQMLDIFSIRIDGDTQPRLAIDQAVVAEYAEAIAGGDQFPPVQVVCDGAANWLIDGFHRFYAHRKLGRGQIKAVVTTGLLPEAQWLSLTANKTHGLRRTNQDKAKAVVKALKLRPELSDSAIAEHIGVSDKTVAKYRECVANANKARQASKASSGGSGSEIPNLKRRGKDGKKYPARRRRKAKALPHTPVRDVSPPSDVRRHMAMANDPVMAARAIFELFDRPYVQSVSNELQKLLSGTAGPAPTLRDVPAALTH